MMLMMVMTTTMMMMKGKTNRCVESRVHTNLKAIWWFAVVPVHRVVYQLGMVAQLFQCRDGTEHSRCLDLPAANEVACC